MSTRLDFQDRGLGEMIDEVAAKHHCTVKEILSSMRSTHVASARRDVVCHLRGLGMSYPAIGRLIGRDHTSCLEMVNRRRWAATRHGREAAQ